jgi:hypothetical protein
MEQIPITSVSNQTLFTTLNSQSCQINIRQRITGVYLDLFVGNEPVQLAIYGRNMTPMIVDQGLGFTGDLMWIDTLGLNADPVWYGLGTQFALVYLLPSDLALLKGLVPFV